MTDITPPHQQVAVNSRRGHMKTQKASKLLAAAKEGPQVTVEPGPLRASLCHWYHGRLFD